MKTKNVEVKELNLDLDTIIKLKEHSYKNVLDIWKCKRSDLVDIGLSNHEINTIIIELQLRGLDLNSKKY